MKMSELSDYNLLSLIVRIFKCFDDSSSEWDLLWRTDEYFAPISFFINCNDLFWWACSDLELITPENIHLLEQSFADVYTIIPEDNFKDPYYDMRQAFACRLFCCRARKLRPQGCAYPKDSRMWPLFDVCGPERTVDFSNPKPHP